MAAVSRSGDALPWHTYPCIDFLKYCSYEDKTVLEFGAGQSTLWWAQRAKRIVAFEGGEVWLLELKPRAPSNVELYLVPVGSPSACVEAVKRILSFRSEPRFDVIVIDGLWRYEMIDIAASVVTATGIIIYDNAEGYDFYEGFRSRDFHRVDFFGNAPGVRVAPLHVDFLSAWLVCIRFGIPHTSDCKRKVSDRALQPTPYSVRPCLALASGRV